MGLGQRVVCGPGGLTDATPGRADRVREAMNQYQRPATARRRSRHIRAAQRSGGFNEPGTGRAEILRDATAEGVHRRALSDHDLWRSRGAEVLTPPKDKYGETRCYIRDPDGYMIEVGQSKPDFAYG